MARNCVVGDLKRICSAGAGAELVDAFDAEPLGVGGVEFNGAARKTAVMDGET